MHRLLTCLFGLAMLFIIGPQVAEAQEGASKLRIGGGFVLDFAGEADSDAGGRGRGRGVDDDLDVTLGLRGHLDYDLGRYFSIGGFARLSWWKSDHMDDRSLLFDVGPRVAVHYDWRDFRFYLAGMPGLLISNLDDDYGLEETSLGFTMTITPGVEYWFSDKLAVYGEFLGWVGHYFSHDAALGNGEVDFSLNQVAFNVGVVFAP